jgi:hypothetical protein
MKRSDQAVQALPGSPPGTEGDVLDVALVGTVDHRWEGRNGLIRVVEVAHAPRDVVYGALESLHHHMEWAGRRHHRELQHVVGLEGPPVLSVGDRFETKQHTKLGHWIDESIVVMASRPERLGFDTKGVHWTTAGQRTAAGNWQHRYHLDEASNSSTVIRYSCRWELLEGRMDVYAAVVIAANVQRGVLNLVELSEELAVNGVDGARSISG